MDKNLQREIQYRKAHNWLIKKLNGLSKKTIPYYILKVMDLLLTFPAFERNVIEIRDKFKINPEKIIKSATKIAKNKENLSFINTSETLEGFNPSNLFLFLRIRISKRKQKKLNMLYNKVKNWERKQFPSLMREIGLLRLVHFGKIPVSWSIPIKNYILYNEIYDYPLFDRRWPEIDLKTDPYTFEPYVQIKIYADTDLSIMGKKKIMQEFQKRLFTFHKRKRQTEIVLLRRWIYYYLRKKTGLNHKEANLWLEFWGFPKIDWWHASEELTRFERFFFKKEFKDSYKNHCEGKGN